MLVNPKKNFRLKSDFKPTGDQPQAIAKLTEQLTLGITDNVLLGVTGSGKTYTIANLIANIKRPTLVISHNKTLAGQLYQEFRDFFPENAVSYFISYYDFYQPEAYIPQTDTYIEKETEINEEIDKLRLAATTNLLTRKDVIVIASVSCIYNIGSPKEYGHFILELRSGTKLKRDQILKRLVELQYERSDFGFHRGSFRVRGPTIDIYPAYDDTGIRINMCALGIEKIEKIDVVSGRVNQVLPATVVYPAKHFLTDPAKNEPVFSQIRQDLEKQVRLFKSQGKILEAHRISQRVNYDLEMIKEMGYVNGIENYSRYFDGRSPGSRPNSLLDYFDESAGAGNWLLVIDESHMTVPQIRGMYNGDRSRKQTLIDFGFRLPAALDNRPLRFDEFISIKPATVYVSATPDEWEIGRCRDAFSNIYPSRNDYLTQQLIRPTGLTDPEIEFKPTRDQIADVIREITKRTIKKERVLVTTLTKRMAEDLAAYLEERGISVTYLHSEIETLKRTELLTDLRTGRYDVLIGVNLLREGLDLPEVSLVVIMDADKEGFLRSKTSLIQTMGRAARHINSRVILYADRITDSMKLAAEEVQRRRLFQQEYNRKNMITPVSVVKPIRDIIALSEKTTRQDEKNPDMTEEEIARMTPLDRKNTVRRLTILMKHASRDLDFEQAAKIRDLIAKLESDK
jgi:excinuclease ABC subunit B